MTPAELLRDLIDDYLLDYEKERLEAEQELDEIDHKTGFPNEGVSYTKAYHVEGLPDIITGSDNASRAVWFKRPKRVG